MNPLRCRISRRPAEVLAKPHFYYCPHCQRLLWDLLPAGKNPHCCGQEMEEIIPQSDNGNYTYEIRGGFDNNAVLLYWKESAPLWAALLTFTGFYCKVVAAAKKPPLVFPLADEDAYVYCGRKKCVQCLYACKRGCVLFCYEGQGLLLSLPLTDTASYFHQHD